MQIGLISLLDGLVYGMLLFMLASGLTLILSMMGVLNFAHASIYMLGAYFAYQIGHWVGFWPALVLAPAAVRRDRRGDRGLGAAARAPQRPYRRTAVHLRPGVHHRPRRADGLGHAADAVSRAGVARFPAVHALRREFPGLSRLHAAGVGRHAVRHLAAAEEDPHRPDHPGVADPSRHGQRARPQRAARVHHRVCRRLVCSPGWPG